jgi:hypothetical protein
VFVGGVIARFLANRQDTMTRLSAAAAVRALAKEFLHFVTAHVDYHSGVT